MLPGRQYSIDDIFRLLRRRFWLMLVPFSVVGAATAMVARQLPDQFRSEAVILVVPQQVPENYVRSTVTTRIEDRVQSIGQQILSRTRLEHTIDDMNLYPAERRKSTMEDVVALMRKDIHVDVIRSDAFTVQYIGKDPRTVQKVAEHLGSLFIEANLQDRAVLAEGTDQFLGTQLEDARRRLQEQEKRLEQYREKFSGQLPSQVQSNLQALQSVQLQIQATLEATNRDHDRRVVDDRLLAELQAGTEAPADKPAATAATGDTTGTFTGTTAQQLSAARDALAQLEGRGLKSDHPDVQHMKRIIKDLESKVDSEALSRPVTAEVSVSPSQAARQKRITELQEEMNLLDKRMAANQEQEKHLREVATEYQKRVDAVPARESEMTELTRDYSVLQTMYTGLLAKKEESQIAANLERRQIGEQFKLLDPAQVPDKAFSPNRPSIITGGLAAGLAFGLAIIALLEYRDSTFGADDEVTRILALPVLAIVPLMQSDRERRNAVIRRFVVGFGLGSTVLVCLAAVVYTLVR